MSKRIICLLMILIINTVNVSADSNQLYYCDEIQNSTGIYCIQYFNNTIEKNEMMNNISDNYISAINDLDKIINKENPTNQEIVWSIKRIAQIQKLILKFLKVIYQIII